MPKVSVIMNVYNGSRYLREAMDSVIAQSFTDWELISWDDHSSDDSGEIVTAYGDDRIRYFRSPRNTGLGPARELAIREAKGEWLAFLDQDDLWMPDKLQRQLALAEDQASVGLVYGRTVTFSADGRQRDFDHRHEFERLPEGDIFERLFTDSCFISIGSAIMRRSAVREIGGIPEGILTSADYHLYLAVARIYRVRAVQDVVCRYRLHGTSMTRSSGQTIHEEALRLIDRWSDDLDPRLAKRRRRVHNSLVAVAQMRSLGTAGSGVARLLRRGSVSYVLSRPFARAFRGIRRRVRRPYWTRAGDGAARVSVLDTLVSAGTFTAADHALAALVASRCPGYVSSANAYSVTLARGDPEYREIINRAKWVTTDGMAVVWALLLLGRATERVHTDDLFLSCCERHPRWRHFLVGGRQGQPEVVAAEMRRRFPEIQVVGTHPTPQRPVPSAETELILQKIRETRPDIVWVGMGTPAQDYWMSETAPLAGLPMVGVGSAFDLLAGATRLTPGWMKRSGLQWLFRLLQEPRRLAFRYAYHNSWFVLAFAAQLVSRASSSRAA